MKTIQQLLIELKDYFIKNDPFKIGYRGLCSYIFHLGYKELITKDEANLLKNYIYKNCRTNMRKNNQWRIYFWPLNAKGHALRLKWLNYHIKKNETKL